MQTLPRILFKPLLLAALTTVGLAAALVSDAEGDVLAWISLAYVVGTGVVYALPRRSPARQRGTDDARERA